jgi:SAM-dependent MidA family methyltransferase
MTALTEIILRKIRDHGPLSFHDFMEIALYHPQLGYYTSERNKIGLDGDFNTSAEYTSLFGKIIAVQLIEMWTILGKKEFTIVEFGAGTGLLCHDILNHLKGHQRMYDGLNYYIIEKSIAMRAKEKIILNEKVTWLNSINDLKEISGCILSNELLDNFSVHRIKMENELQEIFVDYQNGFLEIEQPANKILNDYFSFTGMQISKGAYGEINLEAAEWIKDVARILRSGFVLTIDYGYTSLEMENSISRTDTLACYSRHLKSKNIFINIGEQDITADVNFSALHRFGLLNGLQSCGITGQFYFIHSLGIVNLLREEEQHVAQLREPIDRIMLRSAFLTDVRNRFKVMIQQKGIPSTVLTGLMLHREPL